MNAAESNGEIEAGRFYTCHDIYARYNHAEGVIMVRSKAAKYIDVQSELDMKLTDQQVVKVPFVSINYSQNVAKFCMQHLIREDITASPKCTETKLALLKLVLIHREQILTDDVSSDEDLMHNFASFLLK